MAQLFSNNAASTLAAGISDVATTITLATGTGALFQSPTTPDYELATISDGTNWEVVKITARTGDTLTVTRAFEGTARAWTTGGTIEGRVTKATLELFTQGLDTSSFVLKPTGEIAIGTSATAGGTFDISIGTNSASTYGNSVSIGYNSVANNAGISVGRETVSQPYGVAVGATANAKQYGVAIGRGATCGPFGGVAIGDYAYAVDTDYAVAIGGYAEARIPLTHVVAGLSIVRNDNNLVTGYGDEIVDYVGQQNIILSKEINLKTVLDDAVTLAIPTGSTFFLDEIGVVITSASGVTGQPSISFGITGNTTAILASTPTTKSAAKGRDVFTPLSKDGVTSLTASVKTAATGTTLLGRFYWKGILVEDE